MFKKAILAGVAVIGMLGASQVMAAPFDNGLAHIGHMQAEQARMIEDGIRRGDLTPSEADRLNGEQRQIRETERRYERHGLTRADVGDLENMLTRAERHIRHELDNGDRVPRDHGGRHWGNGRHGNPPAPPSAPLAPAPHHHMGGYNH